MWQCLYLNLLLVFEFLCFLFLQLPHTLSLEQVSFVAKSEIMASSLISPLCVHYVLSSEMDFFPRATGRLLSHVPSLSPGILRMWLMSAWQKCMEPILKNACPGPTPPFFLLNVLCRTVACHRQAFLKQSHGNGRTALATSMLHC